MLKLFMFVTLFLIGVRFLLVAISGNDEVPQGQPFDTDKKHLEDYPDFHSHH